MFQKSIYTVLIAVLSSICTLLCYQYISNKSTHKTEQENYSYFVNNSDINLGGNLRQYFHSTEPTSFTKAAKLSIPTVVAVLVDAKHSVHKPNMPSTSTGSGVIISDKGHVVTNYHVIEDAKNITVIDDRGFEFSAKLLGFDKHSDIAVLKIEASNTTYLPFGNSDSIAIGEWVLAIGNPFKLQSSVTAGIVSARGRDINLLSRQGIESFIQTDAAINPGNSGGALVNTNGELVGINTAILSQSGSYEGFAFAIPSNIVQKVANDIIQYGAVQRGCLGISIQNITPSIARSNNMPTNAGVIIELIEAKSAADDAGFDRNDIIISINGLPTSNTSLFTEQLAKYRPGDDVTIGYYRNGTLTEKKVKLRNQLNTTEFISVRRDPEFMEIGFEVRDLDSTEKNRLKTSGVYIVSVKRGSIAHATNMEPSYILTEWNGMRIQSTNQLLDVVKHSSGEITLKGFYEKFPGSYPYSFYLK